MRELILNEIEEVNGGGLSQGESVGVNLGIVSIGVGIALAGTAPAWFPILMIGVSASATMSFLLD